MLFSSAIFFDKTAALASKMPYELINGYTNGFNGDGQNAHIVDLRSDTISKPTNEMRDAMYVADVGDDVYGEDPTVKSLEMKSIQLLGKEAAVFLPSGTMANLIAIMVHCHGRGSELIAGDNGHTFRFEQGGPSAIAGVSQALVKNKEDGTWDLDEMVERIRMDPDCHEPTTNLVIVENTHNMCGGKVLPLEWLDKLATICQRYQIPVHMDGARIFNASIASKVPPSRIARDMDTICFCLSKGLGAPIGSVLLGPRSFIEKARRTRKILGGGMRQSGFVAAAGLVALEKMIDRLQVDHDHTYQIAKAINDMNSKIIKVALECVQTNILMVYLDKSKVTAKEFLTRAATVLETDPVKVSLRGTSRDSGCVRFVLYWEITDEDTQAAISKLQFIIHEFTNRSTLPSFS